MLQLILKALIIGGIVVGGAELAKKSAVLSAILISLPLTSIVALTFIYLDSKSTEKVAAVSINIIWMVLPSLVFFLVLSLLLRNNLKFFPALGLSIALMTAAYSAYVTLLNKWGITI